MSVGLQSDRKCRTLASAALKQISKPCSGSFDSFLKVLRVLKVFEKFWLISCHWSLSVPPENITKPFYVFSGYRKWLVAWNEFINFWGRVSTMIVINQQSIRSFEESVIKLNLFMPIVSFNTPWKHQKTRDFLIFSGDIEKHHWHEKG